MKIVLIRHGMTQGNINKRYIGCATDEGLAQKGREMLKDISYPPIEKVFSSPMKRCIETARIIYPEHRAEAVSDLREMDFGIFEGKSHTELNGNADYQSWIDSNGLSKIPNGESFDEFCTRCCNAFISAVNKAKSQSIAFVVHGGTIMAVLHTLGGYNYFNYIADNGRGYICSLENNKIKVEEKI